ncbi:MAG: 50S ribosomal protein L11 methyltransferase [Sphingomonadales bacterium]|nr:50S ribosomal protein L11 methyltransferase [Sphingomonadales bacterium]
MEGHAELVSEFGEIADRSSEYRAQQPWLPTSEAIFVWDDAFHDLMLGDKLRMQKYRRAIFETVQPGDVVVDLGVGSGILSYWAIEAGARIVYGIEMSDPILDRALRSLERADVKDRFVPVRGISYDVTLPERADVLISEIIGNMGDNENIQSILSDAKARFLRPEGRCIPEWVEAWIVPVDADLAHAAVASGRIEVLNAGYQIEDIKRGRASNSLFDLYYDCIIPGSCQLASPIRLQRYGGDWTQSAQYDVSSTFRLARTGRFSGFKAFFKAQLSPDCILDISGDDIAARACSDSWKHAYLPIEDPIDCRGGDILTLNYARSTKQREGRGLGQVYRWDGFVERDGTRIAGFSQSTA